MKLVIISDTHGKHNEIPPLPEGDILIHCGDVSNVGGFTEVKNFLEWFSRQPFLYKLFIAGNHDFLFEKSSVIAEQLITNYYHSGVRYLENSEIIIEGIKFYGTPIVPPFNNWAFNTPIEERQKYWKLIPADTDILITHTQPNGILDLSNHGNIHCGCVNLHYEVFHRIKPKIHCFGDIHEAYGEVKHKGIHFINASLLDENYQITNKPITIEI